MASSVSGLMGLSRHMAWYRMPSLHINICLRCWRGPRTRLLIRPILIDRGHLLAWPGRCLISITIGLTRHQSTIPLWPSTRDRGGDTLRANGQTDQTRYQRQRRRLRAYRLTSIRTDQSATMLLHLSPHRLRTYSLAHLINTEILTQPDSLCPLVLILRTSRRISTNGGNSIQVLIAMWTTRCSIGIRSSLNTLALPRWLLRFSLCSLCL